MRYCGNCGAPLDEQSIANRQCATCGTAIHASGDLPYQGDGGTQAVPSATGSNQLSPHAPPPLWQVAPPPPTALPRRQGAPIGLAFGAGIITTLLLIVLLLAFVARHPRGQSTSIPLGQTSATATTRPVHSTPAPGTTATALPSATPTLTATPATTPTPSPTQTPPATTPQASLSVQPQTDFTFPTCFNRSFNFDIVNTGQAQMPFNLTNTTPYRVNPTTGTVKEGDKQTIMVSKITGVGTSTIIVNAPGARNAPITVSIHCTT